MCLGIGGKYVVSIKDIAKKAGVSISTVSYALNGSPKVTEETSARILSIAKELKYVPNAAARTLKKRETKIIGVFLTDFSGAFYGQLLHGLQETLSSYGYDLIVCSGLQSHRLLAERMVDGAIILDETFSSEELVNHADRGHKLVVLDRQLDHPDIIKVLLDNNTGAALAIKYLIEKGHQKLYVVTGPKGSYDSNQRLESVREIVNKNPQIEYKEIQGNFDRQSGTAAAQKIIQEYQGPTAVFCLNDEMAIGMYHFLEGTNYRVGKEIHIVGFDNMDISEFTRPRLSTINYSKHDWGSAAAEQLIKLITNESVENKEIGVCLIEGQSVNSL
jgi:LacI family transcriptional regulator